MTQTLTEALLSLRNCVEGQEDAHFNPPRTEADVRGRLESTFGSAGIGDLVRLFSWHDGQPPGSGLFKERCCRLMSLDEAFEHIHFTQDENEDLAYPFQKNWFPIATNDNGDFTCYEVGTRKIIDYWHDYPPPSVGSESLEEFLQTLIEEIQEEGSSD